MTLLTLTFETCCPLSTDSLEESINRIELQSRIAIDMRFKAFTKTFPKVARHANHITRVATVLLGIAGRKSHS